MFVSQALFEAEGAWENKIKDIMKNVHVPYVARSRKGLPVFWERIK